MQDFHQLKVWKADHGFTLSVYQVTRNFPKEEAYALTNQIRRASASIPTNIAEGCCRTGLEFARFLQIALGSASETEYQLLLAHDLGYISDCDYAMLNQKVVEIKQMLTGLIRNVKSRQGGESHQS